MEFFEFVLVLISKMSSLKVFSIGLDLKKIGVRVENVWLGIGLDLENVSFENIWLGPDQENGGVSVENFWMVFVLISKNVVSFENVWLGFSVELESDRFFFVCRLRIEFCVFRKSSYTIG